MKTIKIKLYAVILYLIVTSCTQHPNHMEPNNQLDLTQDITGVYNGKIELVKNGSEYEAVVNVEKNSNTSLIINLESVILDTTFKLDLYYHSDSVMFCINGRGFENQYGHRKADMQNMMNNHKMWSWQHHLDEEHHARDRHYGSFNRNDRSFNISFFNSDNQTYKYYFSSYKQ